MVDSLHGEVHSHELNDRLESIEPCTDSQTSEAGFRNRRVDDSLRAKIVQHSLGDFVSTLILADLFTHEEDVRIASHFVAHRNAKSVSYGQLL